MTAKGSYVNRSNLPGDQGKDHSEPSRLVKHTAHNECPLLRKET